MNIREGCMYARAGTTDREVTLAVPLTTSEQDAAIEMLDGRPIYIVRVSSCYSTRDRVPQGIDPAIGMWMEVTFYQPEGEP